MVQYYQYFFVGFSSVGFIMFVGVDIKIILSFYFIILLCWIHVVCLYFNVNSEFIVGACFVDGTNYCLVML